MRYNIADHDYRVKLRNAQEILKDRDKIKVSIMLPGPGNQHKTLAMNLILKFQKELEDLAFVDMEPKLDGKSVIMTLSPNSLKRGRASG
jgi:translation initiation factor IF-3